MNIAEVFQNKTRQNFIEQGMNRIHLLNLTSLRGCLLTSAKRGVNRIHQSSIITSAKQGMNRIHQSSITSIKGCTIRNRLVKGTAKVYSPPAQGTGVT